LNDTGQRFDSSEAMTCALCAIGTESSRSSVHASSKRSVAVDRGIVRGNATAMPIE
jgi:hypothetical protein